MTTFHGSWPSALAGAAVWIVVAIARALGLGRISLIDLLFLLAPLVLVPLGLRLLPQVDAYPRRLMHAGLIGQPLAAAAVVISLFFPAGRPAGMLAIPWLLVCVAVGLAGVLRLARSTSLTHVVPVAALADLAFGAAWLVISRLGLQPLEFSPVIVKLTAVHFHYAGFMATLLAALTAGAIAPARRLASRLGAGSALSIVAGSPVLAAGFATSSSLLQTIGTILIALGVLGTAGLQYCLVAPRVQPVAARWLLRLSALAVVLPMLLAVEYSAGHLFGFPTLNTQVMALVHGDLNAVGFAGFGLFGWTLAARVDAAYAPSAAA